MTKILKSEEFINEQVVNEMGMRVRNANIKQRMPDQLKKSNMVYNANIQQRMPDLLKKYNLVYNEATGLYDCDGDVKVEKDLVSPDGKLVINFGVVKGNFDCRYNKLISLEGAPQEVGGDFSCSYNKLTSLKGAPQEVGGDFYCHNNKLTLLVGAPQEVDGSFWCDHNELTSLEGAPKKVSGNFGCYYNQLTTLKGAPQEVGRNFECYSNNLVFDETNFYGCLPDVIGGKLDAGPDCDYELAKDYYNPK